SIAHGIVMRSSIMPARTGGTKLPSASSMFSRTSWNGVGSKVLQTDKGMAITVRHADLKRDRDELIRFLYQDLTNRSDDKRFDWLYLNSPAGQGVVSLAIEEPSSRTVGAAAVFPRQFWFHGKPKRVWVLGDFCITRDSRTLGPALLLQRACLNSLARE